MKKRIVINEQGYLLKNVNQEILLEEDNPRDEYKAKAREERINRNQNFKDNQEKELEANREEQRNRDWDSRYRTLASDETPNARQTFWNEYFEEYWGNLSRAAKSLGNTFIDDLVTYGFTEKNNPLVAYLKFWQKEDGSFPKGFGASTYDIFHNNYEKSTQATENNAEMFPLAPQALKLGRKGNRLQDLNIIYNPSLFKLGGGDIQALLDKQEEYRKLINSSHFSDYLARYFNSKARVANRVGKKIEVDKDLEGYLLYKIFTGDILKPKYFKEILSDEALKDIPSFKNVDIWKNGVNFNSPRDIAKVIQALAKQAGDNLDQENEEKNTLKAKYEKQISLDNFKKTLTKRKQKIEDNIKVLKQYLEDTGVPYDSKDIEEQEERLETLKNELNELKAINYPTKEEEIKIESLGRTIEKINKDLSNPFLKQLRVFEGLIDELTAKQKNPKAARDLYINTLTNKKFINPDVMKALKDSKKNRYSDLNIGDMKFELQNNQKEFEKIKRDNQVDYELYKILNNALKVLHKGGNLEDAKSPIDNAPLIKAMNVPIGIDKLKQRRNDSNKLSNEDRKTLINLSKLAAEYRKQLDSIPLTQKLEANRRRDNQLKKKLGDKLTSEEKINLNSGKDIIGKEFTSAYAQSEKNLAKAKQLRNNRLNTTDESEIAKAWADWWLAIFENKEMTKEVRAKMFGGLVKALLEFVEASNKKKNAIKKKVQSTPQEYYEGMRRAAQKANFKPNVNLVFKMIGYLREYAPKILK